eukprot:Clim_evm81s149 gene=Clim_evmTU81s149
MSALLRSLDAFRVYLFGEPEGDELQHLVETLYLCGLTLPPYLATGGSGSTVQSWTTSSCNFQSETASSVESTSNSPRSPWQSRSPRSNSTGSAPLNGLTAQIDQTAKIRLQNVDPPVCDVKDPRYSKQLARHLRGLCRCQAGGMNDGHLHVADYYRRQLPASWGMNASLAIELLRECYFDLDRTIEVWYERQKLWQLLVEPIDETVTPRGAKNVGNTCYAGALLLAMFSYSDAFDPLLRRTYEKAEINRLRNAILVFVNRVRTGLGGSEDVMYQLMDALYQCGWQRRGQQDAGELFLFILDCLDAPLLPMRERMITGQQGKPSFRITCERIVQLYVPQGPSCDLMDLLDAYFHDKSEAPEETSTGNRTETTDHKAQNGSPNGAVRGDYTKLPDQSEKLEVREGTATASNSYRSSQIRMKPPQVSRQLSLLSDAQKHEVMSSQLRSGSAGSLAARSETTPTTRRKGTIRHTHGGRPFRHAVEHSYDDVAALARSPPPTSLKGPSALTATVSVESGLGQYTNKLDKNGENIPVNGRDTAKSPGVSIQSSRGTATDVPSLTLPTNQDEADLSKAGKIPWRMLTMLPWYIYSSTESKYEAVQAYSQSTEGHALLLPITLSRYTRKGWRTNTKVNIPAVIDFSKFVARHPADRLNAKHKWLLRLHSCVCHKGTNVYRGHFISYSFTGQRWVRFDDMQWYGNMKANLSDYERFWNEICLDSYILIYELVRGNPDGTTSRPVVLPHINGDHSPMARNTTNACVVM